MMGENKINLKNIDVQGDIKNIINKIENSEKEWKALYMGIWLGVYRLEDKFKKSGELLLICMTQN